MLHGGDTAGKKSNKNICSHGALRASWERENKQIKLNAI